MPSKKKYNARFPAGRIKKIMQTDEDVGKVAQAVPVIISRTLELFVESLLKRAVQITSAKNAKTLTPSHMKQCILSESRFDFLKDLVRGIPDISNVEDESMTQIGNISPGMSSPFEKSANSFSCFQFRRNSDGGSSKMTGTSQLTSVPHAPQKYGDHLIQNHELKKEEMLQSVSCRAPVIQHTRSNFNNHTSLVTKVDNDSEKSVSLSKLQSSEANDEVEDKLTKCTNVKNKRNSSSDDYDGGGGGDDDDVDSDDEPQENGYHKLQIVTKSYSIDEDYDT